MSLGRFTEIWLVDFEFHQPAGELPEPLCMVAREYRTGRVIRHWCDDSSLPISFGPSSLFVAYYASAELSCLLALGQSLPPFVLDLFTEFRCETNGLYLTNGGGLLGAMAYCGLPCIDHSEKTDMRDLAIRGGPFTANEKSALVDYCETDVTALAKLLEKMEPHLDVDRALLRGRYMAAVAHMERDGIPIDTETLALLRENWNNIKAELVSRVDSEFGVYDGLTFKQDRFSNYLVRHDIPWPRTETGRLSLSDDSFRQMSRTFPTVAPLRELRHSLSEMRLESLSVGSDGRNRCMLSAFRSSTGRNQPSNTKFSFGPSVWIRGLIRPARGRALAYVDWSQQEFGIAASLSGDKNMLDAYSSGDPYLAFAKQAGAVPSDATKESHSQERDQFKVCALAVQYGMGPQSLSEALGQPTAFGRELLRLHRQTYPTFWDWSEAAVSHAMIHGWLKTVFGWTVQVGHRANPRSLANFPMQGNGSEMLRLACCLATERGVQVCAPVHDALLVEGPDRFIEQVVTETQQAMAEASRHVLAGFELASDAKIIRWPDRYMDDRGETMWKTVTNLLETKVWCTSTPQLPCAPPLG